MPRPTRYRTQDRHQAALDRQRQEQLQIGVPASAGPRSSHGLRGVALGTREQVRALTTARNPREAWINWVAPRFACDSAYFTGTYSDDYGFRFGLMVPRNVHKDLRRFLDKEINLQDRDFISGVEKHRYRDILHFHGIIQGPFTARELEYLKALWSLSRGHCKVLPVKDGCASYVTKYALKGDTECFDWRLS